MKYIGLTCQKNDPFSPQEGSFLISGALHFQFLNSLFETYKFTRIKNGLCFVENLGILKRNIV